jgi:hypothetical protein
MLIRTNRDLWRRSLQICATVAFAAMLPQASLGASLPGVPGLPSLPIGGLPGGGGPGGGPGGGGPGGGGPGSGGPGSAGFVVGGAAGPSSGLSLPDDGSGIPGTTGLTTKWGDPLSTDLLGNGSVHARLKYFGESGAQGTTQAVGIKFSLSQ